MVVKAQKIPMSFESELLSFAHNIEKSNEAAYDLWTWLPSYRKAKNCLGDYACNVRPNTADIMREACDFIADACNPDAERLATHYLYECSCCGDCPNQASES
jgi:hypothetical protein